MQASPAAYALIREFEGLELKAYCCSAGVLTIGYGHTKGVKPGMAITLGRAEELLRQDVANCEREVSALLRVGVTQNQFDALVSFVFNLGATALRSSTMLRRINNGEPASVLDEFGEEQGVAAEFKKWVMATNPKTKQLVKLPGLVSRRAAEAALFAK